MEEASDHNQGAECFHEQPASFLITGRIELDDDDPIHLEMHHSNEDIMQLWKFGWNLKNDPFTDEKKEIQIENLRFVKIIIMMRLKYMKAVLVWKLQGPDNPTLRPFAANNEVIFGQNYIRNLWQR